MVSDRNAARLAVAALAVVAGVSCTRSVETPQPAAPASLAATDSALSEGQTSKAALPREAAIGNLVVSVRPEKESIGLFSGQQAVFVIELLNKGVAGRDPAIVANLWEFWQSPGPYITTEWETREDGSVTVRSAAYCGGVLEQWGMDVCARSGQTVITLEPQQRYTLTIRENIHEGTHKWYVEHKPGGAFDKDPDAAVEACVNVIGQYEDIYYVLGVIKGSRDNEVITRAVECLIPLHVVSQKRPECVAALLDIVKRTKSTLLKNTALEGLQRAETRIGGVPPDKASLEGVTAWAEEFLRSHPEAATAYNDVKPQPD